MRRRRMGVSRLQKKKAEQKRFAAAAKEIEASDLAHVSKLMAKFKVRERVMGTDSREANVVATINLQNDLEKFALENKDQIRKSPQFRNEFQRMCSSIGVDPLVSNKGTQNTLSTHTHTHTHTHTVCKRKIHLCNYYNCKW